MRYPSSYNNNTLTDLPASAWNVQLADENGYKITEANPLPISISTSIPSTVSIGNTFVPVNLADTDIRDAFGRLRVSTPVTLFDAQLTYDLQPLLYQPIASGTGATVTHDSTMECNSNGIGALPPIVMQTGYLAATAQSKSSVGTKTTFRYPITLDADGNHRNFGMIRNWAGQAR